LISDNEELKLKLEDYEEIKEKKKIDDDLHLERYSDLLHAIETNKNVNADLEYARRDR
jgi:hypothetical protein